MNNENTKMSARPGPSDSLNSALYDKMEKIAKWTVPCTFSRTEKAPIDSKSVFATLDALQEYINDKVYGTAYPGQIVAVTYDTENNGVYILTSQYVEVEKDVWEYKLIPTRLGTKAEINAATASAVINWLDANGNTFDDQQQ